MSSIKTINPATEEVISEYKLHNISDIKQIISLCHTQQQDWAKSHIEQRLKLIEKFSQVLEQEKQSIASLMTQEMGKPIKESIAEVEKCITLCEFYVESAEKHLQPVHVKTNFSKSYYMYCPLGIIFGIMPWNFPLWQVMRYAIPNLISGNSIMLKHAPNVTGIALKIEEMFMKANFPQNLFRTIVITEDLAEEVIKDAKVAAVTITGSKRAGSDVASKAGKYLKKVVLELGGNDPYIILEDADLDLAAEQCVKSRLLNTGQVCIAAKRIIVVESVREELENKIINLVKQHEYSNPSLTTATLGPIARKDLRDNLEKQVDTSIREGAKCLYKSNIPNGKGYYYPVTVLNNIDTENIAFKEELFGPIFCIISAKDTNQAIEYANMSEYGLTGVLFTKDIEKGHEICEKELHFGTCNLNSMVFSDPRLPFGGIKNSGFGRELAEAGLKEFVNIKTINIK